MTDVAGGDVEGGNGVDLDIAPSDYFPPSGDPDTPYTYDSVKNAIEVKKPIETVEQLRARLKSAREEVDALERRVRTVLPPRRGNERVAVSVVRNVAQQPARQPKAPAMLPPSRMPLILERLQRGHYKGMW